MPRLPSRPLRILARPAFSSAQKNPYTSLVYGQVQALGHHVAEFSLRAALLERWDVVHVHWPESVFNHTLIEALPTTESLLFALRSARRRGAKVLWTAHNLQAHERRHPQWEARFRQHYLATLDGFVGLSDAGIEATRTTYPELAHVPAWCVPHPHYRGQYPDACTREEARAALGIAPERRVLLSFGRIFEYKNFEAVISAVRSTEDPNWLVLVAGAPRDARVEHTLRAAAGTDPRIHLELSFVPREALQRYLRAADLIVQPYREILNSGTALLALSFDRPVLLPHRGAGAELARVLGAPWVQTFGGTLLAAHLEAACDAAATLAPGARAPLEPFEPHAVGACQVRAYEELVAS